MQLHVNDILQYATKEQILHSTYLIGGRVQIRLFNSKEYLANVPALFNNSKHLKHKFSRREFDNVSILVHDYKDGNITGNRKTDLVVINPLTELSLTNEDIKGWASHDNNTISV